MSRMALTEGQPGSLGAGDDGKVAEARDRRAAEGFYWAYSGTLLKLKVAFKMKAHLRQLSHQVVPVQMYYLTSFHLSLGP
ncbi:hypothetical protein SKAU_G00097810 [Synaphobranchus kaupii]|uniref:Uncharacterized protein n=1 Tax=Synaphobranchus kaupii TaxID=118154 RepID=A0A9Q1J755_SYNKA|nr:hypothetical protein SKAU_G00097810 [Synaphobranchus kaupii]